MKRISKMKHTKGAVLFAVVAVMALLIAMATTAYYTARSAYNSVVSNYNYSQLYLSAISVSDMLTEAVTNDSIASATGPSSTGKIRNNYDDLRTVILAMETPGQTTTVYSNGISESTALSGNAEAIINELSTQDSLIAGALDGIVIEIELVDNTQLMPVAPNPQPLGGDYYCYWYEYDYRFKTTAYYRNNSITVEDAVVSSKSRIWKADPGSTRPVINTDIIPGTDPIDPIPGNSIVSFDTFFTATGQIIDSTSGSPDIGRTSREVIIKAHQISDDAFFQNDHTFFVNGNNNEFLGGITSTGSVYLDKFTTNIQGSNNDWYIGEDLVILGSNGQNLNLNNGGAYDNNLYVGRDLVLGGSGPSINATDIYVEGDLYILGQANITGNLHVAGNIYQQSGENIVDENGNVVRQSATTIAQNKGYPLNGGNTTWDHFSNGWKVTGNLDVNGNVNIPDGKSGTFNVNVGGSQLNLNDGADASSNSHGVIGTFNPDDIVVDVVNRVPNEDTDKFEDVTTQSSVKDTIQAQAGTNKEYNSYTSPQSAYDRVIDVDFSALQPIEDEDGNITGYEYNGSVPGTTLTYKIECTGGNVYDGPIKVTLPFSEDGYTLDISGNVNSLCGNADIRYEIDGGSDKTATTPIVLKDNITAPDGSKGFSWMGDRYNNNGKATEVVVKGDGNVVFEMANFNKTTNKYEPYNPDKYEDYETVQYVASQKEAVCTEAQLAVINADNKDGTLSDTDVGSMLADGSTPKEEYFSQIMLVSNVNNGTAVDAARQNNVFCGYIYAPNGEYNNDCNAGTVPVFGGMIVSTYKTNLAHFYYAEPKPSRISDMLGSMTSLTPGDDNGGSPGVPGTPDIPVTFTDRVPVPPPGTGNWVGDRQFADYWNVTGSNYVG